MARAQLTEPRAWADLDRVSLGRIDRPEGDVMTSSPPSSDVVVVGAGLTGLLAARRLRHAGLVVQVIEASAQVGGQIRDATVGPRQLDVGAEAMHLAAPQVGALIEELGLTDTMITARRGTSWLLTPAGLRPLPDGVGPAGPTRLRPVLTSRVMTTKGLARAGLEPALARRGGIDLSPGHDISVGDFVAARFGRQVVDRFVDPLLGSLHAGDVRTLSLRACAPTLVPAAREGRPLVRTPRLTRRGDTPGGPSTSGRAGSPGGAGSAAGPGGPGGPSGQPPRPVMSFVSWPDGLGTIVQRLCTDPRPEVGAHPVAKANLDVRLNTAVTSIERVRHPDRHQGRPYYHLTLSDGSTLSADGVILAIPAAAAARLLGPLAPGAARLLDQVQTATVATVVAGYPRHLVADLPALQGNGLLVPSTVGSLLKAATFLSRKWSQLADPDLFWVRMSAGRAGSQAVASRDDATLLDHLRRDLREFTGLDVHPVHTHIERWPNAMPQLTVGHPDRMIEARRYLAELPGIALAGASYDGIGLASCITSATTAARLVSETLAERTVGAAD